MKLEKLLENVDIIEKINYKENIDISCVCDNSLNVKKGALFVCINGFTANGQNYALDAEKLGASVIVTTNKLEVNITQIIVKNERIALSVIAKNFYNNAVEKLKVIGVVGTNGKSSCSQIIFDMLSYLNKKVGLIGTNIIRYNGNVFENNMTTPDPLLLHKTFYEMLNAGIEYVVMEVSAHAIYLNKVKGIMFETLLFTNISQDHLDFFKDMETYSKVKIDFFNIANTKSAVINIDDKQGINILGKNDLPIITYGIKNPSDIFAIDIKLNLKQ